MTWITGEEERAARTLGLARKSEGVAGSCPEESPGRSLKLMERKQALEGRGQGLTWQREGALKRPG